MCRRGSAFGWLQNRTVSALAFWGFANIIAAAGILSLMLGFTLVAHERLMRNCFIDYDREMALVVERVSPSTGEREILAVGRLTKTRAADEAELAALVGDLFDGTQWARN